MRLPPIDAPTSWMMKFWYWIAQRRYGAVPMPLRVVYARRPRLWWVSLKVARAMERLSLEEPLPLLISAQTSAVRGCRVCHDLALAEAILSGVGEDKFLALPSFQSSPLFTQREHAALSFVSEAARLGRVDDVTFRALWQCFTEEEIIEVIWLYAATTYFNAISVPLDLEPDGLLALAQRARGAPLR